MIIRNSQFNAMGAQRLLYQVVEIICAAYPDARPALASDEGRRVLQEQYHKANQYGLSSELDTARYLITAWHLGIDFDSRFPAMREALNDPNLSAGRKAEIIERFCIMLLQTLKGKARR